MEGEHIFSPQHTENNLSRLGVRFVNVPIMASCPGQNVVLATPIWHSSSDFLFAAARVTAPLPERFGNHGFLRRFACSAWALPFEPQA